MLGYQQSFAVGKTARHKESFVAIRLSIGCYSWIKEYNVDIMVCSNLSENNCKLWKHCKLFSCYTGVNLKTNNQGSKVGKTKEPCNGCRNTAAHVLGYGAVLCYSCPQHIHKECRNVC